MRALLEGVAAAGVAVLFGLLLVYWPQLPDHVPAHFNAAGRPDRWAGKASMWALPLSGLFVYGMMTAVAALSPRYPRLLNMPVRLTAENRARQIELAGDLLRWLKAELCVLFAWMLYRSAETALGRAEGLGRELLPVMLTAVPGTIAVYLYRSWRAR